MAANVSILPKRPDPVKRIGNVDLFKCDAYSALISVAQCRANKGGEAPRSKYGPRRFKPKEPDPERHMDFSAEALVRDRKSRCAGCPGILRLAAGEKPTPKPARTPAPEPPDMHHIDAADKIAICQGVRRQYWFVGGVTIDQVAKQFRVSRSVASKMLYGQGPYKEVAFEPDVAEARANSSKQAKKMVRDVRVSRA